MHSPQPAVHANNFTLVRLLAALVVMVGHSLYLRYSADMLAGDSYPWSDISVQAFFVTSGILVYDSYRRSPTPLSFYISRLMRIYPLYAVVILLQAAAMALVLTSRNAFHLSDLVHYLFWNGMFANFKAPDMGGLFAALPSPAVNPSLWTLKLEVIFYLIVPLLFIVRQKLGQMALVALAAGSVVYFLLTYRVDPVFARQLPGQLRFFLAGMLLAEWQHRLPRIPLPMALTATVGLLSVAAWLHGAPLQGLEAVLQPIVVASLVAMVALVLPPFPEPRDVSYGLYLLHAPLVQTALLAGIAIDGPMRLSLLAGSVIALAFAANYVIEQPFIDLGRRLTCQIGRRRTESDLVRRDATGATPRSFDTDPRKEIQECS